MSPDAYPALIPHVSFGDGRLFFGHRPVREATTAEWEALVRCDGSAPLRDCVGAAAGAAVAPRMAPWLTWWEEALPARREPGGTVTRLVFSPRPSDAWLAMGGTLLASADHCATHVVACFGLVAETVDPVAFRTPNDVSSIARDEIAMAARAARATHEEWDFPARELREMGRGMRASVEWMRNMVREAVTDAVDRVQPEEVFAPSAADPDSDAGVVLDILVEMHVGGELGSARLCVYQSTAMSLGFRPVDEFLSRFDRSYVHLAPLNGDLSHVMARKRSLLELFRSCTTSRSRRMWTESAKRTARIAGRERTERAEQMWRVDVQGAGVA
jgi:LmbE family N-acetylglucosaminyl deacetylase